MLKVANRIKVKSLNLRTLTDVSMTERSDGSGVITFGPQMANAFITGAWMGWMSNSAGSNFEQIENAKRGCAFRAFRRGRHTTAELSDELCGSQSAGNG